MGKEGSSSWSWGSLADGDISMLRWKSMAPGVPPDVLMSPGKHGVIVLAWLLWRWIHLHCFFLWRHIHHHGLNVVFGWINIHWFWFAAAPLNLTLLG